MTKFRFIILSLFLLLPSCNSKLRQYDYESYAMDTIFHITVYTSLPKARIDELVSPVFQEISRLENKYSAFVTDSVVYRLNRTGSAGYDEELNSVLAAARRYSEATGGAFDITVLPLMRLWGFTTREYRLPPPAEIAAALSEVDYRNVVSGTNGVRLAGGAQIDLGGIVKGYAVDKLAAELQTAGVEGGIVNAGGNIRAFGKKPGGGDWNIGIRHPREAGGVIAAYAFPGGFSIATSGDYERYFITNGVRYCHIMSPFTGRPVRNGVVSVSVVTAGSARDADALSTSLFVMGLDKGLAFALSNRLPVLFVCESNGLLRLTNSPAWDYERLNLTN